MAGKFTAAWDGWEYEPTDEDLLYLGVALYGETRGHHTPAEWGRILWTWMNRFMLHGARGKVFTSLAYLIKYHSQPVNPKWRLGGQSCPQVGADDSNCSPHRLNWRAEMEAKLNAGYEGFRSIPQEQQDFVVSFLNGCVPEPKTVDGSPFVDFGANQTAKKYGKSYESGGNWFITKNQWVVAGKAMPFVPDHVVPPECGGIDHYEIEDTSSKVSVQAVFGTLVVAGILGMLWWLKPWR